MKKENQPGNYQLKADLEGNYLIDKEHKATKRLGIFYAPSGGSVHKVARLIKQKLVDLQPDLFVISDVTPLPSPGITAITGLSQSDPGLFDFRPEYLGNGTKRSLVVIFTQNAPDSFGRSKGCYRRVGGSCQLSE